MHYNSLHFIFVSFPTPTSHYDELITIHLQIARDKPNLRRGPFYWRAYGSCIFRLKALGPKKRSRNFVNKRAFLLQWCLFLSFSRQYPLSHFFSWGCWKVGTGGGRTGGRDEEGVRGARERIDGMREDEREVVRWGEVGESGYLNSVFSR